MANFPITAPATKSGWKYYTAPGGGFSTGVILDLVDKIVEEVYRDGFKYRLVTTALPVGKQFNFDPFRGEILFDTNGPPLELGEQLIIRYGRDIIHPGSGSGSSEA